MKMLNGFCVTAATLSLVIFAATDHAHAQGESDIAVTQANAQTLSIQVGRSKLIVAPWPVIRVSVSQPDIADVQVVSPREVLVVGMSLGQCDFLMWSEDGEVIQRTVNVNADLAFLQEELKRLFPDSTLEIDQSRDVVLVKGQVRRAQDTVNLHALLDTMGVPYVDFSTVAGVQQVQLKVRMAEVSRNVIKVLAANAVYADGSQFYGQTLGSAGGGALNPISIGPLSGTPVGANLPFNFTSDVAVSPLITLFGGFPNSNFQFFLQALVENQYLRILAEPTLTALSGEEASFLAGGEFPIPVVQGSSGSSGTSITIEYREFGVKLAFRPVVLGDNTIRLYVAPEVSDITDTGAIEIQGFRVPALVTRRTETTVELKSGQTLVMSGLLQQSTRSRVSHIPILANLPILGTLFRSTRYERSETELIVLVTASLVEPINAGAQLPIPGVAYVTPNDWELFVEGRIIGKNAPVISPSDQAWLKKLNVDKLLGPGGWVNYPNEFAGVPEQPRRQRRRFQD